MKLFNFLIFVTCIFFLVFQSCDQSGDIGDQPEFVDYYPSSKPCTRWWWFATKIKKEDVKYQLDWAKENNFGGVEVAWVYPLYRFQTWYRGTFNRHYKKDTTAQKWLSPEWIDVVEYTKSYADSIGLACDFTFGSAWPVAGENIDKEHTVKVYGDTSFRQTLTFA